MYAIQQEGEIVIAVPDVRPFGWENDGDVTGFAVALGEDIATALEVEARYVLADSEDMAEMVSGDDPVEIGDEEVQVAFPLLPLTQDIYKVETRELGYRVTTPYYVGHQKLLVPSGSEIDDVEDLEGKTVCQFIDPATGVSLDRLVDSVDIIEADDYEDCARALETEDAQAATAVDPYLIAMLADLDGGNPPTDYEITGEQITTEGYAPFTVKGMETFASDVFNDAEAGGGWTEAHDRFIGKVTGEEGVEPPILTAIDAAALYPLTVVPDADGEE